VFRVAVTYIGTVVGAGFASGQETLRFFGSYGRPGLVGIGVSTILLCTYGILIMDLGRRLHAVSHKEVLLYACGDTLGRIMDVVITLCLGATLVVMIAGGGAIFGEQLRVPLLIGTIVTAALAGWTILAGMRGIMFANSVVVPLLTIAVLGLSGSAIYNHGMGMIVARTVPWPLLAPVKSWFVAALLYAGYNLVLSISVLAPLGAAIQDRRAIVLGGLVGGLALGALSMGIKLAINAHMPDIGRVEVPMLFLARLHDRPVQWFYTLILWAEIYTTAIACAFGFAHRVASMTGQSYRRVVVAIMLLGLVGSSFGFSNLLSLLYPIFGFVTLIILAGLTILPFRRSVP
jgi:uncharacterized membrane protein YkvI